MNTTAPSLIDKVHDLLKNGVSEVFRTMLALEPKPAELPHDWHAAGETLVAGSVGFIGDVNGIVYVHVTAAFARTLASRMLGLSEAELEGDEMVNDAIGELSNMVVGSVKSHLCDSGAPCVLTIPSIVRGQNFRIDPACSSERRLISFCCGTDCIVVELLTKYSA